MTNKDLGNTPSRWGLRGYLVREAYKKDKGVQIWNREIIAEKYFGGQKTGT